MKLRQVPTSASECHRTSLGEGLLGLLRQGLQTFFLDRIITRVSLAKHFNLEPNF